MQSIYLDYAASTPLDKRITWQYPLGNTASIHSFGKQAMHTVDQVRDQLVHFLGASHPKEVIFTSGATESNNMICTGIVLEAYHDCSSLNKKPHVITTNIEHSSVLEPLQWLESRGYCTVTYLQPDTSGRITADQVSEVLQDTTCLVTIQYVNNEIGTVQPIAEIGELLQNHPAVFHTDAVQAAQYFSCNVHELKVDALSLSGHKIYGPQGVGVLYIDKHVFIEPLLRGGEQEFGKRAGTLNVFGINAFGQAINLLQNNQTAYKQHSEEMYSYLQPQLEKLASHKIFNGSLDQHAPHIINYSFPETTSEKLLLALDMAGIAVSAGSACHAGAIEPSHVIKALDKNNKARLESSLRISWGKETTKADIQKFIETLQSII